MNKYQQKSLELFDKLPSEMSNEDFLKEYELVEKNSGPTVKDFIIIAPFNSFLKK